MSEPALAALLPGDPQSAVLFLGSVRGLHLGPQSGPAGHGKAIAAFGKTRLLQPGEIQVVSYSGALELFAPAVLGTIFGNPP